MPNSRRQQQEVVAPPAPRTWRLLAAGVVGLAFAFRYYRLADMPPGLHYDEAFNGIDAAALLATPLRQWPIFFTGNFGREPLFNYILAGATALFGPGLMTLRLAILTIRSYGVWVTEMPGARVQEEANSSGLDTPAYSLSVALVV